ARHQLSEEAIRKDGLFAFLSFLKILRETFSPSSYRLDIRPIPGYCQLSGCLNVYTYAVRI
ncbi:hypothetical protein, partial [Lelliottia wanjuensis]